MLCLAGKWRGDQIWKLSQGDKSDKHQNGIFVITMSIISLCGSVLLRVDFYIHF